MNLCFYIENVYFMINLIFDVILFGFMILYFYSLVATIKCFIVSNNVKNMIFKLFNVISWL
jgi:hypothetical protein